VLTKVHGAVIKKIGYNEFHRPIGEGHPRAKLSDDDVERIRTLHEEGMTYMALSVMFETPVPSIAKICRLERRNNFAIYYKVKV